MLNNIRKALSNIPGWSTKRHIVVFESDDWGSVRIRSKADYDAMMFAGINLDKNPFTMFDGLETNSDLEGLFDVLSKHKDSTGRAAVFTPMCIVANPDFKKIKESGYKEYYYKTVSETTADYDNSEMVVTLWKEGSKNRLFMPALHGREHLHVNSYLNHLEKYEAFRIALDHESFGIRWYKKAEMKGHDHCGAFAPEHKTEIPKLVEVAHDACRLFEQICGYKATHFIGCSAQPAIEVEMALADEGVKYITQAKLCKYPLGDGEFKRAYYWLGKINKRTGQMAMMRNGWFEPMHRKGDYVDSCMSDIALAFKYHKPCIISSHRANYCGRIVPENASNGLMNLDKLLYRIIKTWPDVEFMTSTELGEIIRKEKGLA